MLQIHIVRFPLSLSKCHHTWQSQQLTLVFSGIYNDSLNDAAWLATTIMSSLIPSLNRAIEFYIKFADGQEDPFAQGTLVSAMEGMVAARWQELNEGSNLAKVAKKVFMDFQDDSQTALNMVRSSHTLFGHCFLKRCLFTAHLPCQ